MFNIGTGEMIMIAVVALLVLGPQRLPELARGIGKFMREFRRQTDDVRNVVEREFYRMDQEVMNTPQVHAAPDAVPQGEHGQLHDGAHHPVADGPPPEHPVPSEPQQAELQLQAPVAAGSPAALDESEPGHPDYHREEKPAEDPPPAGGETPEAQKVG